MAVYRNSPTCPTCGIVIAKDVKKYIEENKDVLKTELNKNKK